MKTVGRNLRTTAASGEGLGQGAKHASMGFRTDGLGGGLVGGALDVSGSLTLRCLCPWAGWGGGGQESTGAPPPMATSTPPCWPLADIVLPLELTR